MSASPVERVVTEPPATTDRPNVREILRDLRVLAGPLPEFDPTTSPTEPAALFVDWLLAAIEAGVPEPHAMTLSTVDANGHPSARQLSLIDVTERGWHFAVNTTSRKAKELAAQPWVALTFYWQPLGRQVRIRGSVHSLGADVSAEDFQSRPADSKLSAVIGRQSQPLADPAELPTAVATAEAQLAEKPGLTTPEWRLYKVKATEVEFFQGDVEQRHTRLRYFRSGTSWGQQRLWP